MQSALEGMVLGDELAGYARALLEELPVDDAAIALDEIMAVGPGGDHLARRMTRERHRLFWQADLTDQQTHERWRAAGARPLLARVRERLRELRAAPPPFALDPPAAATLDDMVAAWRDDPRSTGASGSTPPPAAASPAMPRAPIQWRDRARSRTCRRPTTRMTMNWIPDDYRNPDPGHAPAAADGASPSEPAGRTARRRSGRRRAAREVFPTSPPSRLPPASSACSPGPLLISDPTARYVILAADLVAIAFGALGVWASFRRFARLDYAVAAIVMGGISLFLWVQYVSDPPQGGT